MFLNEHIVFLNIPSVFDTEYFSCNLFKLTELQVSFELFVILHSIVLELVFEYLEVKHSSSDGFDQVDCNWGETFWKFERHLMTKVFKCDINALAELAASLVLLSKTAYYLIWYHEADFISSRMNKIIQTRFLIDFSGEVHVFWREFT